MELPAMSESLLREHWDDRDRWDPPVKNLDKFFTSMYLYYTNKGLPTIILNQFCAVFSLGFTVSFSAFLIAFVDWSKLSNCRDEESCGIFSDYVISNPFNTSSHLFSFLVILYIILFGAFWIWKCISGIYLVSSAIDMERFYREILGIHLNDLQTMGWHEVVQRLIKLHEHGIHRVAIKEKLTEHDVVLRIMRKDNYMIGLINKQLMDLRVPWWIAPFMSERLFLTKSLEWSLSFCIMEYVFNEQFTVSSTFLKGSADLQRRFIVVGIIHFLLLPFMLVFMTIHFFLQNFQQFHSSRAYLGPRTWSPLALWTFREFNELSHIFEERINKTFIPANDYLSLFYNPNTAVVARCVAYISGAFVATLIVVSFIGEGILLYVHISNHNLLWYVGIFSAIFAGSRSVIPDDTKSRDAPEDLVQKVVSCTHYFPTHWTSRCHTIPVKDELAELFPFKINLFAMEVMSVVLTPLVLCFSLPSSASTIIDFFKDHSKYVEGVGAVCDYSLFDFDRYGDERYGAPAAGRMDESQRLQNGKLEASFFNFQNAHPNWEGDEKGRAMIDRVDTYRLNRENERDQQISAALEQSMAMHSNSVFGQNLFNNSYREANQSIPIPPPQENKKPTSTVPQPANKSDSLPKLPDNSLPQIVETYLSNDNVNNYGDVSNNDSDETGSPLGMTLPSLSMPSISVSNGTWGPKGYSQVLTSDKDDDNLKNNSNSPRQGISPKQGRHGRVEVSFFNNEGGFNNWGGQSPRTRPSIGHIRPDATTATSRNNNLPSVLRSILKQENIDYENDFYWLNRFQQERKSLGPSEMEKSLLQSQNLGGISRFGFNSAADINFADSGKINKGINSSKKVKSFEISEDVNEASV
jgi:autophagy-related protein 9